jgi:hypothetical protein
MAPRHFLDLYKVPPAELRAIMDEASGARPLVATAPAAPPTTTLRRRGACWP